MTGNLSVVLERALKFARLVHQKYNVNKIAKRKVCLNLFMIE